MIEQLSVLLQNEKGRLAELTRALGDANVNMHALTTADTAEFGVIRIICDRPKETAEMLRDHGFAVTLNQVVAIEIPDHAGGLAHVFEVLDDADIALEYSYCFAAHGGTAADILKSADPRAQDTLRSAGVVVYEPADLYIPDSQNA